MLSIATNEQQLLRCLIEQPDNITELEDNYFVSPLARDIYQTLYNLYNRETSVKPTVSHIVSEGNKINQAITPDLINNLLQVEFDPDSFPYYKLRLKKDHAQHEITDVLLKDTLENTITKGELDLDKIERLMEKVEHNVQIIKGERHVIKSPKEIIDIYSDVLQKRKKGEWIFPTGDSYLDKHLAFGFLPGQMTTLFAATGMGKSMFALNLVNKQINKGIPSLYLSLEMDLIATFDRLLCIRAGIPMRYLWPDQFANYAEQLEEILELEKDHLLKTNRFLFSEESGISIMDYRYIVREAKKRMKTDYLLATVDLLTMFKDFSQGENTPAYKYESNMNMIHEINKSENIHTFAVVQANRDADMAKVKEWDDLEKLKPSLNNVKNSGAIAERSRIVMSAFRKMHYASQYLPDDERIETEPDIMEINILKQNMGPLAHLKYLFDSDTGRIAKYIHDPVRKTDD